MLVEQALFTSTNAGHLHGYQLVARSNGINDRLAAELCRWSPSQGALHEETDDAVSFNYFPLSDEWFAISRSTYGGPEYSRRGSLRVTTHIVVLTANQFARFSWNAFHVARAAMSSGAMFLEFGFDANMPPLPLPDQTLPRKPARITTQHQQVAVSAGSGQLVAVVGSAAPQEFAAVVVDILPEENRASTSFSTGLNLTEQRPFRLQFFPRADIRLENKLKRMEIETVRCNGMPLPEATR